MTLNPITHSFVVGFEKFVQLYSKNKNEKKFTSDTYRNFKTLFEEMKKNNKENLFARGIKPLYRDNTKLNENNFTFNTKKHENIEKNSFIKNIKLNLLLVFYKINVKMLIILFW